MDLLFLSVSALCGVLFIWAVSMTIYHFSSETECPRCAEGKECPTCPGCPKAPECPKGPDCPNCPPEKVCPEGKACPVCPEGKDCPACPTCPVCTNNGLSPIITIAPEAGKRYLIYAPITNNFLKYSENGSIVANGIRFGAMQFGNYEEAQKETFIFTFEPLNLSWKPYRIRTINGNYLIVNTFDPRLVGVVTPRDGRVTSGAHELEYIINPSGYGQVTFTVPTMSRLLAQTPIMDGSDLKKLLPANPSNQLIARETLGDSLAAQFMIIEVPQAKN